MVILRRALLQLAIGLPVGLAGAFAVGRILEGILIQTKAGDPATLSSVVLLLVVVSVVACLSPARRASRLDPMIALRYE